MSDNQAKKAYLVAYQLGIDIEMRYETGFALNVK